MHARLVTRSPHLPASMPAATAAATADAEATLRLYDDVFETLSLFRNKHP